MKYPLSVWMWMSEYSAIDLAKIGSERNMNSMHRTQKRLSHHSIVQFFLLLLLLLFSAHVALHRGRSSNLKYINMFMRRAYTHRLYIHISFAFIVHHKLHFAVRRQNIYFSSLFNSWFIKNIASGIRSHCIRGWFIFLRRVSFPPKERILHFPWKCIISFVCTHTLRCDSIRTIAWEICWRMLSQNVEAFGQK